MQEEMHGRAADGRHKLGFSIHLESRGKIVCQAQGVVVPDRYHEQALKSSTKRCGAWTVVLWRTLEGSYEWAREHLRVLYHSGGKERAGF